MNDIIREGQHMELVNLTPHTINIYINDGIEVATIPPSGVVARCKQESEFVGRFFAKGAACGITVTREKFGAVENLPAYEDGKFYIVSKLVAQAIAGTRSDILVPGPMIRTEDGQPIGCIGLSII